MRNKIDAAPGPDSSVTLVLPGHMAPTAKWSWASRTCTRWALGAGKGGQLILVALLKPLLFAMVVIFSSKSMWVVREQTNLSWNCQQCSFLALQIPAGPGLNPEVLQTAEVWETLDELTVFPRNYHFGSVSYDRNLYCFAYGSIAVNPPEWCGCMPWERQMWTVAWRALTVRCVCARAWAAQLALWEVWDFIRTGSMWSHGQKVILWWLTVKTGCCYRGCSARPFLGVALL